jgi:hypothetical protein
MSSGVLRNFADERAAQVLLWDKVREEVLQAEK